jgi:DDE superfamily endonuclease
MNLNTLIEFRQQVYACLESRADALFSLCDGLLSESQARTLPELSHSPFFLHQWPSIYAALADGKINIERLQAVCVRSVLAELPEDAPVWIAVDATPMQRPAAETSEDRGYIHVSNLPLADKPISIGWMFSVVGLLPEQTSSWVPPLDFQRISTEQTAVGVAIDQLRRLKPLFGTRQVIVVADRCYGTPDMLRACQELGYGVLIRLKSNRKLYRQPVRRFPRGRLPQDGPLLQGTRPETQGDPSETWETTDQVGRMTRVSRFDEVHFQQERGLLLSVIRVERASARGTKRDPRVSWFLTLENVVPLEQVPQRYGLRFSEEHLFRFLKQDLLWLAARVCTPEQVLRWSWIVALAFLQLYLARELGQHALLPWEAKGRPVTPRQIRRLMPTLLSQLGTPVRMCQPRGKAPGRAKGFRPQPAPRYPVIQKTSKKEKKRKTPPST